MGDKSNMPNCHALTVTLSRPNSLTFTWMAQDRNC